MRTEPAFSRYEALLKRLHDLNREGQLDSPEADAVREEMDKPWSRLSEFERKSLAGMSSDLYSLSGEETIHDSDPDKSVLMERARAAYESSDWEGLLKVLRLTHQYFPPEVVAYMRGRCWQQLGRNEPAFWFFDQAHRLDRSNRHYALLRLDALLRAGRRQQALVEAKQLLETQNAPVLLLFGAAKVFYDSADYLPSDEARQLYESIVQSVSTALQTIDQDDTLEAKPQQSLILAGRLHLALALEKLGRHSEAEQAYIQAISHHPNSDELLMARALFLLRNDSPAAQKDLEALVSRGTSLVYAHLFRAHYFLTQKDYDRCLEFSDRGLRLSTRTDTRVMFLEWTAISLYEKNAPLDDVRSILEEALSIDPLNENVRSNLLALSQTAATSHQPLTTQVVPDPFAALQDLRTQLQPAVPARSIRARLTGDVSRSGREIAG